MATDDDVRGLAHVGDPPLGLHWSAARPSGAQQDDATDYAVRGPVIRLMWDYGVRFPLWDAAGLLPEEPEWLRKALGLSDWLIDDLRMWGLDMEKLDADPSRRTEAAYEALRVSGQQLARRLQRELDSRYSVNYRPW